MAYLVFAQSDALEIPVPALAAQAARFFDASLEGAGETTGSGSRRVVFHRGDARQVFSVAVRAVGPDDVQSARAAEARTRAAGLGDLAARCRTVFVVSPETPFEEWLALTFAALLASVALGPILLPDGSALLGVRSARERAEKLRTPDA